MCRAHVAFGAQMEITCSMRKDVRHVRAHPTPRFNASVDLRAIVRCESVRRTAALAATSPTPTAAEHATVHLRRARNARRQCVACSACTGSVAMRTVAKCASATTRRSRALASSVKTCARTDIARTTAVRWKGEWCMSTRRFAFSRLPDVFVQRGSIGDGDR